MVLVDVAGRDGCDRRRCESAAAVVDSPRPLGWETRFPTVLAIFGVAEFHAAVALIRLHLCSTLQDFNWHTRVARSLSDSWTSCFKVSHMPRSKKGQGTEKPFCLVALKVGEFIQKSYRLFQIS